MNSIITIEIDNLNEIKHEYENDVIKTIKQGMIDVIKTHVDEDVYCSDDNDMFIIKTNLNVNESFDKVENLRKKIKKVGKKHEIYFTISALISKNPFIKKGRDIKINMDSVAIYTPLNINDKNMNKYSQEEDDAFKKFVQKEKKKTPEDIDKQFDKLREEPQEQNKEEEKAFEKLRKEQEGTESPEIKERLPRQYPQDDSATALHSALRAGYTHAQWITNPEHDYEDYPNCGCPEMNGQILTIEEMVTGLNYNAPMFEKTHVGCKCELRIYNLERPELEPYIIGPGNRIAMSIFQFIKTGGLK